MLAFKILLLGLVAVVFVHGCHHNKEDVPPDTFPEDGSEVPSRKKRSITSQSDVDKELSDFFTLCMFEKTGSVFNSWRSVIDFVLRDTRWYTASDFQYCKENAVFDAKSVSCWQDRLKNLVRVNSRLLPKAQECVEEFQWAEEDLPVRRGKRSVSGGSSSSGGFDTCLGVSRKQYGNCVQGQLITTQNLRQYPSLKNYDEKSVDEFVENEFSDCRITSRSTFYGNVYTESCPSKSSVYYVKPKKQCLSSIFREIVRTPSPLYAATRTCMNKYTSDKCVYVECSRPGEQCDKNTGLCGSNDKCRQVYCGGANEICDPNTRRCVCKPGYERDSRGRCTMNKCSLVFCGNPNEVCDPKTGRCVCKPGYDRDIRGRCTMDRCSRVYCANLNEVCDPNTGRCICKPEYERDSRGICRIDRCAQVYCNRPNEMCDPNTGRCVCKSRYEKDSIGICTMDKCERVYCPGTYESCDKTTGRCVCYPGYSRDIFGTCKKIDPCDSKDCGPNSGCRVRNQRAICYCLSGYVKNSNGYGCRKRDPCFNKKCPANSDCVQGICVCRAGYKMDGNKCVLKDPCSTKKCGKNKHCIVVPKLNIGICICNSGYTQQGSGCRKIDPCDGVKCGPNSKCVSGTCVCNGGYRKDSDGNCVRIDPCSTRRCDKNMECKVIGNRVVCVCLPGYVPDQRLGGCKLEDPCDGVDCQPNSRCVQGECICNSGYLMNRQGFCVKKDPCELIRCAKNMECKVRSNRGVCVCRPGYERDPQAPGCKLKGCEPRNCGIVPPCFRPVCLAHPKAVCKSSNCDCSEWYEDSNGNRVNCTLDIDFCKGYCDEPAEVCLMQNGEPRCKCATGYTMNQFGICVDTDPCADVQCAPNMRCDAGVCVCNPGFIPNPKGPGCISGVVDPCKGRLCPPFSDCVAGDCVCRPGYKKDRGFCMKIDACDSLKCGRNMECVAGSCVCLPGFVPSLSRPECVQSDPCAGRNCPPNSQCVAGDCICEPGYQKRNGICISIDPCRSGALKCGPNMDCMNGACTCKPGYTPAPHGRPGCVRRVVDVCTTISCPDQSDCVFGDCICRLGYIMKNEVCHEDNAWSQWSEWRQCSKTCGEGVQVRYRTCDGPNCKGQSVESRKCSLKPCGVVDNSCGTCPENSYCRNRRCICNTGYNRLDDGSCIMCSSPKIFNQCPSICYPRCGSTTGGGPQCATVCRSGVYCECPTGYVEKSITNSTCVRIRDCPGRWNDWEQWGTCSRRCGTGIQSRRRTCNGNNCEGQAFESRNCNTFSCGGGGCPANKVSNSCPTRCPKHCDNRGREISCQAGCRDGVRCVCKEGMIERSAKNTTCIVPEHCPGLCWPNPCKHGGKCQAVGAYHICQCKPGYAGKNCEIGCGEYCRPNGSCTRGRCVCNRGFVDNGEGGCRRG